ncbi:MAG: Calx-beta domain-containing protein, partial [Pseudohongiellaceae bacterium]
VVTLTPASFASVTLRYDTSDATPASATAGTDYTAAVMGMLTFNPGDSVMTISVTVTNDTDAGEGAETMSMVLTEPMPPDVFGAGNTSLTATGTINDDDIIMVIQPVVSIAADGGVTEVKEADDTYATFVITAAPAPSGSDLSVSVTVDDGAGDYITAPAPSAVTISDGETTTTFSVQIVNDKTDEANGSVTADIVMSPDDQYLLSMAAGATTATVNVIDDDIPVVNIADASANEGDDLLFIVTWPEQASRGDVFMVRPGFGTNASAEDLIAAHRVSRDINVAAGTTSLTVTVTTLVDTETEGAETFTLLIDSGNEMAELGTATGTINANTAMPTTPTPTIALDDGTNGGVTTDNITNVGRPIFNLGNLVTGASVTILAVGPAPDNVIHMRKTITANAATASVKYGADQDGDPPSGLDGSCEFRGEFSANFDGESDCYFSNPEDLFDGDWEITAFQVAAGVTSSTVSLMITMDIVPPTVTLASGTTNLMHGNDTLITVTASEPSTLLAVDDFTVTNGTLSNFMPVMGSDTEYTAYFKAINTTTNPITATILVGTSTFTDIAGNDNDEVSNTLSITVTPATVPIIFIADASVTEAAMSGELSYLEFAVTLAPTSADEVSFSYASADGTAEAGTDYNATSGSLTFAANASMLTITVTVEGDNIIESDETMSLVLSSPVPTTALPTSAIPAIGTIMDNENYKVTLSGPVSVKEGERITWRVSADRPVTGGDLHVRIGRDKGVTVPAFQLETGGGTVPEQVPGTPGDYEGTLTSRRVTIGENNISATYVLTLHDLGGLHNNSNALVEIVDPNTAMNDSTNYDYDDGNANSESIVVIESDPFSLSIAAGTPTIDEGEDAVFTITASRAPRREDVIVQAPTTESGSFIDGTAPTTATLPVNMSSVNYTVATDDDDTIEASGSITAALMAWTPGGSNTLTGYSLGSPTNATITVNDNDVAVPAITIVADQSDPIDEGTTATYTLTATPAPSGADLVVNVAVSGATNFLMGGVSPSAVTIADGAATAILSVVTEDDTTAEANGYLVATVSAGTGYTLGMPSAASVIVLSEDSSASNPLISLSTTIPTSVTEGDMLNIVIVASPSQPATFASEVAVSQTRDFITIDSDNLGRITFNDNPNTSTMITVTVTLDDDGVAGTGGGTIVLTVPPISILSGDTWAVGTPSSITITVADAGVPTPQTVVPTITLADASNGGVTTDLITNDGTPTFDLSDLVTDATVVVTAVGTGILDYRITLTATGATDSVTFMDGATGCESVIKASGMAFPGTTCGLGDAFAAGGITTWDISATQQSPGETISDTTDLGTVTIDLGAPTITLTGATAELAVDATTTITITVSEASTLAADDFTVTGGALSSFTQTTGSDTEYTATFTAANSTTTAITANISVAASTFTDTAGNDNEASAALEIPVAAGEEPPTGPTVSVTIEDGTGNAVTSVDEGDPILVVLSLSSPITDYFFATHSFVGAQTKDYVVEATWVGTQTAASLPAGSFSSGGTKITVTIPTFANGVEDSATGNGTYSYTVVSVSDGASDLDPANTDTVWTATAPTSASVTIRDTDVAAADPVMSIAADGGITSIAENGSPAFRITSTPRPAVGTTIAVNVQLTGTGNFFSETLPTTITAFIETGGRTLTLTDILANDIVDEPDGSLTATIQTGDGYTIADAPGNSVTFTITDEDVAPRLRLVGPTAAADEDGGDTLEFTVRIERGDGSLHTS